jgi:subfamily B ATP-binding cassette protein HlyB/CyaB
VARVRELENIRQFLTSSALTLVIDLFFTVVFLAVMFYYSPLLTFAVLRKLPSHCSYAFWSAPWLRSTPAFQWSNSLRAGFELAVQSAGKAFPTT